MKIWTSHYGLKELPAGAVAIRSSVGRPKYGRHGDAPSASLITPSGWMLKLEKAEYERVYREKLDKGGAEAIRAQLMDAGRGHDVVVMCFESLRKPGEWCHRRMFATWWEEQTGEVVEEVGGRPVSETFIQQDAFGMLDM